jgi:Domain of unknown function (DUF4169)
MAILRTHALNYLLCPDGVAMGDLVNLKRFKKRKEREQSDRQAETNRARFGRTKSERLADAKRTQHASEMLDQHKMESEDAS